MKQKIEIRVHMTCDKCRSKALGLVASTQGVVERVGIEGNDRDRLVVVGDGVDSVNLTARLRKKMGNAELMKVEAVVSAEAKPEPSPCPQQWYPGYYSWPAVAYPYPDGHCYPYSM
ncbi:heavy metal-associated isoprenylated plant protein 47 [Brachypodium distachyon]|uniref:HMA domain-containing protein n=1 Tax=Brachypodium distachyon TaxID=15368 RepID=I1IYN8_BRADI|nr:heavy metal-associated isoprenylated plant protein 47 [Brachypodium distachyon]KQJ83083.1 hypothetical protein BRADI_5g12930v3 [Brachypodium distachyon]|eukprot:XP_003581337.1 heavy metal-associated isoprenylated plant protein 47 [Brachypodium distachyon]